HNLTWLDHLDLRNNNLTALPGWIGDLVELKSLWLHHNFLKTMPKSLVRLHNLRILVIDGGSSSAACDAIGSLIELEGLALANLKMNSVPDWVHALSKLQTLYLHGNLLTELPSWIGELSKLINISLDANN